jgi:hypothetical protein
MDSQGGAIVISSDTWSSPTLAGNAGSYIYSFDAARVVPTAAENRPANIAVRHLIRALR